MLVDDWIKVISGAGFGVGTALILLWKFFQASDNDKQRLDRLEKFVHDQLLTLIKAESAQTQQCLEVITENTKMTERCMRTLENYEALLMDKHRLNEELLQQIRELRQ